MSDFCPLEAASGANRTNSGCRLEVIFERKDLARKRPIATDEVRAKTEVYER